MNELPDVESLFQRALVSQDEAYLVAERGLRESPGSTPVLTRHLNDADPMSRLMASVMLDWREAEPHDLDAAAAYLDELERRYAGTVAGMPPVTGVIENLSARFGGRLAGFLALRLVRQAQPAWRVLATLGYLDRHKDPATTDALIRFATSTSEPRLQQLAARVLAGMADPALGQKLRAERERLAARGAALPPALASLAAAASAVA